MDRVEIHNVIKLLQVIVVVCVLCSLILFAVFTIIYAYSGNDEPRCRHNVAATGGFGSSGRSGCHGHPPDTLDVKKLKTGDLLVLSYNDVRCVFSRVIFNSVWTHLGLVYIHPATGEPYVLEAAGYNKPYNGLILRIPLMKWIRINRNVKTIGHLPINKALDPEQAIAAFEKYETLDVGVESFRMAWRRFLHAKTPETVDSTSLYASKDRRQPPEPEYTTMNPLGYAIRDTKWVPNCIKEYVGANQKRCEYPLTCTEIVVDILQCTGAVDSRITPCSYLPSCVANRKLPMINGYYYNEPLQVAVDPLVVSGKLY